MLRRTALVAMFLVASSVAAFAADDATPVKGGALNAAVTRAARSEEPAVASWAVTQPLKRPAALTTLYGSYGAIQALDIISTRRAIAAGAREQNPLMRGGSVGTMIGVKAATGAATIFFAERMWKKNKIGAIVVMAALNGASAAIVAHNHQNARR